MSSGRGKVLRTVYGVLSGYAPLTALLQSGAASIIGSTASLDELPVPSVVLRMGSSEPLQRGDEWVWDIVAEVYGLDVFTASDVIDAVEDACDNYRSGPTDPIRLARLEARGFDELDAPLPGQGFNSLAAARCSLRARWAVQ